MSAKRPTYLNLLDLIALTFFFFFFFLVEGLKAGIFFLVAQIRGTKWPGEQIFFQLGPNFVGP